MQIAKKDLQPSFLTIEGIVVKGKQEARQLGTPTANILTPLAIDEGVYAAMTDVPELAALERVPSLAYYRAGILESHLINHDLDLYGHTIKVTLFDFIRPSVPFTSIVQMRIQIGLDLAKVWATFKEL